MITHKFLHRFDEQAKMLWTNEAIETLTPTSTFAKLAKPFLHTDRVEP